MKTLTKGEYTDPLKGKQITCKRCKCVFELEGKKDIERNYYEPDICTAWCPTCDAECNFLDWSIWNE